MEVNRVFISHAIRRENQQDIQKLYSLIELDTINGLLEQVRRDAKQLVNMSDTQFATSVTASLLTDLVANANSTFVGQLDPATNTRQGGTTWVHDVLPQLATLNVEEVSST